MKHQSLNNPDESGQVRGTSTAKVSRTLSTHSVLRTGSFGKVAYLFLILTAASLLIPPIAQAQTAWTELTPTGGPPSSRISHAVVYDPTTNRMTIFGGTSSGPNCGTPCVFNDVWVLQNANGLDATPPAWTQLSPTGGPPTQRWGHSTVYDPTTNRMTIFGGINNVGSCGGTRNDVWVLEGANGVGTPNWIQLFPTGGPPSARRSHNAVYDPGSNRMILFGGMTSSCVPPDPVTDVWILENANGVGTPNWIQLFPTGGPILPSGHTAVYDKANNRMIVLQQCCASSPTPDLWVLENANGLDINGNLVTPNWIQVSPTGGPSSLSSASSVYDPDGNQMFVFTGGGVVNNDVWVIENANGLEGTPNWVLLSPSA